MSSFPSHIKVSVTQAGSDMPVAGIVVGLKILVPEKNDYDMEPRVTDKRGETVFSANEIRHEVELNKRVFPMDYSCSLDQATGAEGFVPDPAQVQRMLEFSELWGKHVPDWALGSKKIQQLRTSANRLYQRNRVRVTMADLLRHPVIEIRLSPSAD